MIYSLEVLSLPRLTSHSPRGVGAACREGRQSADHALSLQRNAGLSPWLVKISQKIGAMIRSVDEGTFSEETLM